jgi:hypothetical protein
MPPPPPSRHFFAIFTIAIFFIFSRHAAFIISRHYFAFAITPRHSLMPARRECTRAGKGVRKQVAVPPSARCYCHSHFAIIFRYAIIIFAISPLLIFLRFRFLLHFRHLITDYAIFAFAATRHAARAQRASARRYAASH